MTLFSSWLESYAAWADRGDIVLCSYRAYAISLPYKASQNSQNIFRNGLEKSGIFAFFQLLFC